MTTEYDPSDYRNPETYRKILKVERIEMVERERGAIDPAWRGYYAHRIEAIDDYLAAEHKPADFCP